MIQLPRWELKDEALQGLFKEWLMVSAAGIIWVSFSGNG